MYNPWSSKLLLRLIQLLWILPNAILGWFVAVVTKVVTGSHIQSNNWIQEVTVNGWLSTLMFTRFRWGAFTLGLTIFYWNYSEFNDVRQRHHERVHIHQQLRWGFLFYPVYLLVWVFNVVKYSRLAAGYWKNPFEIQAYKLADQSAEFPQLQG